MDEETTLPTTDGSNETRDAPGKSATTVEFETAQRNLFAAVGLDAKSRFVDLEKPGVRTHVFEAGLPDDDPPLVFVHGTAASGAFSSPLLARFDDVRTIAFDRLGYGLGDPFVYTEANLRGTVVDALAGVLDELGMNGSTSSATPRVATGIPFAPPSR